VVGLLRGEPLWLEEKAGNMNVIQLLPVIVKAISVAAALVPTVKADVAKIRADPDLKSKIRDALKDLEAVAATLENALEG
jgi:hypothetical protein